MSQKILFIGDGYPVGDNAGSILYLKLIKSYGIEHFCYYGLGNKTKLELPEEFVNMPKEQSSLRIFPQHGYFKVFRIIPLIEEIYYFLFRPLITRRILKFINDNNVTLIIAVFRADVISVINEVKKKSKLQLLGYISDTIEMEFKDRTIIYNLKYNEYYKAIKDAAGIYVAGETMKEFIERGYKKKTSIIRLGFNDNLKLNRSIKDKINIFFSGSVYAKSEFEFFLIALSKFAHKYSEFEIKLFLATNYKVKNIFEGFELINLGWQKEETLYGVMENCHLGYVPYKFDERYKTQMQYAFPSKAGFYLSTGLPLFFHGPAYSSMSIFFKKYQCGIHCTSLKEHEIVEKLEKLIFDEEFYQRCLQEVNKAYYEEFTIEIMRRKFSKLIEYALNE